MKRKWRANTVNAPRTIKVEDGNWIVCYPPRDMGMLKPEIKRTFPSRRYSRLVWIVYPVPANARVLMDFAAKFKFDVTAEARALVDEVLASVTEGDANPDRTISPGVNKDGRPSYLIRFKWKGEDPDYEAIFARVRLLPGAQYIKSAGRAWAVEKIHRDEVLAFAREFNFTLPAELQEAAAIETKENIDNETE